MGIGLGLLVVGIILVAILARHRSVKFYMMLAGIGISGLLTLPVNNTSAAAVGDQCAGTVSSTTTAGAGGSTDDNSGNGATNGGGDSGSSADQCAGAVNMPDGSDGNNGCWPGPESTGVPAGTALTDETVDTSESDVTYQNVRFTNSNATFTGDNITFVNCEFPNGATFRYGTGIRITHSTILSGVYFSSVHDLTFENNEVNNFEDDALYITSDSGSMVSNVSMKNNWVHTPIAQAPSHADALQVRGVEGLELVHNYLDMGPWYTDNGTPVLNSALFFEDANGGNSAITAEGNYLNGGGYTLYATGGAGSITSNTFGPDFAYDYVYPTVDSAFTRSGNKDINGNAVNF